MSYKSYTGTILSVSSEAVLDYMTDCEVVTITLRLADGSEQEVPFLASQGFGIDEKTKAIINGWPVIGELQKTFSEIKSSKGKSPVIPDGKYFWYELTVQGAIGDTVEIGWDYHNMTANLITLGEPRGELIKWSYPVKEVSIEERRAERLEAINALRLRVLLAESKPKGE